MANHRYISLCINRQLNGVDMANNIPSNCQETKLKMVTGLFHLNGCHIEQVNICIAPNLIVAMVDTVEHW